MLEISICLFLYLGGFFMAAAAIGILVLPDLFARMQATTKASSLAVGCFLIAVMLYFQTADIIIRCVAAIVFIFATAPVGAHIIARAAYGRKIPLWEKTKVDELKLYLESIEKKNLPPQKDKTTPPKNILSYASGNAKISEIFKNLRGKKI